MLMAHATEAWTLDQLHRLPDDGNKYELVDGELFVTPAPSTTHEGLALRLRQILEPYVLTHQLGQLFGPKSVVQKHGSEVEPDLMLRKVDFPLPAEWNAMPVPLLVVEVLSRTTARRDQNQKLAFYRGIGVPEYWMVDRNSRTIRVVTAVDDLITGTELTWQPAGAPQSLVIDVEGYFRDVLG
jgi:Uma2 family endonuclease